MNEPAEEKFTGKNANVRALEKATEDGSVVGLMVTFKKEHGMYKIQPILHEDVTPDVLGAIVERLSKMIRSKPERN